jgi:DNA-directed RNA polymerase specialized sigma24 family protein
MVDDLTTEVFLAAIDAAGTYRPDRGGEEAWLFGIARNVMASEQRRAAREPHKSGRAAGRRPLDADDIARLEERIDAESAARHARDGHPPGSSRQHTPVGEDWRVWQADEPEPGVIRLMVTQRLNDKP